MPDTERKRGNADPGKSKRPPRRVAFLYLAPRPGLEPGTCGL